MKVYIALASVILFTSAVMAVPPPPGGAFGGGFGGPYMPPAGAFSSFIPTADEIAALNSLHTTPAPVVAPAGAAPAAPVAGPTAPPTMPPAVASLVNKYMKFSSAFMPPVPPKA